MPTSELVFPVCQVCSVHSVTDRSIIPYCTVQISISISSYRQTIFEHLNPKRCVLIILPLELIDTAHAEHTVGPEFNPSTKIIYHSIRIPFVDEKASSMRK